ncbi:uncharacterized protein LOC114239646 [Bombyx mandarina]|uniref:Uncharacterized protein n=2 Tax=Bombyx TaxID=7090 RepID=A0A8R2R3N3_BOMMO|nr:uncharacterized protein LOC114239646 [Bombyx mandarina]XP_037876282.1 uncharacterized protein LOC119630552 [Bombyx mori]
MVSKVIIALCITLAVASAVPQPATGGAGGWGGWNNGAVNPWIPPWIASAPWYPQWAPCTTIGSTCLDCTTKQVCTKVGGIQRACLDPTLPYCNLGECSATPAEGCEPASGASVAPTA